MKFRWLLSIFILLFVSYGCIDYKQLPPAGNDTATAFVEPTDPILHSPTPEEIPTQTPLPVPTDTLVLQPSAIIAKVEGGPNSFILVGGSLNGSWVGQEGVLESLEANQNFQLYTAFEFQGWISGQKVTYEPICDQHYLTFGPFSIDQSAVAVAGDWEVLPRIPLEIATDSEIYSQALAGWLVEQAPSMPVVSIDKIWLVDVEGNGTDEVFINATHYAEPTGHDVGPRDYSVVLMRTVVGSGVATIKLVGDYYAEEETNKFPLTYTLEFIGDLNGDGRMEVVVGVSRWEGSGVMVFEIDGTEVQLVLSVMCSL
jgi:hypothetical protein